MRVEGARSAEGHEAPHLAEQLLLREHARGVGRELGQQLELLRGKRDREAVDGDSTRRAVEGDGPGRESLPQFRLRPPEHRVDPRDELLVVERPRDEVVAAALERLHPVDGVRARFAEDDHRDVLVPRPARHALA